MVDWSRTAADTAAVMPCPQGLTGILGMPIFSLFMHRNYLSPQGTSGLARWACERNANAATGATFVGDWPDLGRCRSHWLASLHGRLVSQRQSVVHLAKEMVHYLRAQPIYGGDLSPLASTMMVAVTLLSNCGFVIKILSSLADHGVKDEKGTFHHTDKGAASRRGHRSRSVRGARCRLSYGTS